MAPTAARDSGHIRGLLPALTNEFVDWDDEQMFLENPYYRGFSLAHLRWMWTATHMGHYIPLTWMTLGLDYLRESLGASS